MSQFPPQPPGYGQQPNYPQQPGFAPPGGMPPQGYGPGPGYPGQPTPGNGWSIAALVTGLVGFCVPVLGGLLAMLFGVLGIAKSRKTQKGMALSVIGLILGLLSAAGWGLSAGAALAWFKGTQVNRDLANQFIVDVHSGNTAAALAATDGSVSNEKMQELSDRLKRVSNLTIDQVKSIPVGPVPTPDGKSQVIVTSVITGTGSSDMSVQFIQIKQPDGSWKINGIEADAARARVRPFPGGSGSSSPDTTVPSDPPSDK